MSNINNTIKTIVRLDNIYEYVSLNTWNNLSFFLYVLNAFGILIHSFILIYLILSYIKCKVCVLLVKNSRNNKKFKASSYNYVTIAFVGHQCLIDIVRILYCVYYIKNLKEPINVLLTSAYYKYSSQLASLYSILTMVTLVNILTIFICETCRFYDLNLNSNDTSNMCCVIFGVLLIWLSSFIIISSIMLISTSSAAAPTNLFTHELNNTLTLTRTVVTNIIWLFIVSFIVIISILYSRSLYSELNSLDYKHHRISIYALYAPIFSSKNKYKGDKFHRRHYTIVRQTSQRLIILFTLLIALCLTWFPNFLIILLQIFNNNLKSLKILSIFASILWLSNPIFNSLIFLNLFLKEFKKKYNLTLKPQQDGDDDNDAEQEETNLKKATLDCSFCRNGDNDDSMANDIDHDNAMMNNSNECHNNRHINLENVKPNFVDTKLLLMENFEYKIGNKLKNNNESESVFDLKVDII